MSEFLLPHDYDRILSEEVRRVDYPYDQPPVCRDLEGYYRQLMLSSCREGDQFYDTIAGLGQKVVAVFDQRLIVQQDSRKPLLPEPVKVLVMNPSGIVQQMPQEYRTRNFLMRSGSGNYYAGRVHRDFTCSPLRAVNALTAYRTAGHVYGSNLHEMLEYHFQL